MLSQEGDTNRILAFSDAVFAVLITVLVLELKPPEVPSLSAFHSLWPTAISYAISYLFIAIVWTSHHHLLRHAGIVLGSREGNASASWPPLQLSALRLRPAVSSLSPRRRTDKDRLRRHHGAAPAPVWANHKSRLADNVGDRPQLVRSLASNKSTKRRFQPRSPASRLTGSSADFLALPCLCLRAWVMDASSSRCAGQRKGIVIILAQRLAPLCRPDPGDCFDDDLCTSSPVRNPEGRRVLKVRKRTKVMSVGRSAVDQRILIDLGDGLGRHRPLAQPLF